MNWSYYLLLIMLTSFCFAQKQSIFHDEHGKIKPLKVETYFQSLSAESIQEIQKIKLSQGEFAHLATDKSNFYFLSDISQYSDSSKSKFYQSIFIEGYSFQIDHGLPKGIIWVVIPKEKNTITSGRDRITRLLQQSIN